MRKKIFTLLFICCQYSRVQSQNVGIGTMVPNGSAALDITHTSKGLLIPRMASAGITAISNPAKGLMVYDSAQNQLMVNTGTPAAPNWQSIVAGSGWTLTGNSGTNPSNQFIGSTDKQSLKFRVNNIVAGELSPNGSIFMGFNAGQKNHDAQDRNIGIGYNTLQNVSFGDLNTAVGTNSMFSTTRGNQNTGIGENTLYTDTSGSQNTAIGYDCLYGNTNGNYNTALGFGPLNRNTTGNYNTASGAFALGNSITGDNNVATGSHALENNGGGNDNTATGFSAMGLGGTGSFNTATGSNSLYHGNSGNYNTASGYTALFANRTGDYNAAFGTYAMHENSPGSYNTAVGSFALYNTTGSQFNTVVGYRAGGSYDLGYNNTILGANCDAAFAGAYNDIAIGQAVTCTDNSQARIGNSATGSIGGYANWTNISDGRYKKNLKENVQGLAFIMKLRPVTYNLDITGLSNKLNESRGKDVTPLMRTAIAEKEQVVQTGFVAQEVEQAAKETGYAFSGVDKPKTDAGLYGLRYAEFVVPLVKAMQEQQQLILVLLQQNNSLLQRMEKLELLKGAK